MEEKNKFVKEVAEKKYEYGFTTDIQTEIIEKGLNEDVVRLISSKKEEPEWMLEFRLKAFRHWLTMKQPEWGHLTMQIGRASCREEVYIMVSGDS